MMGSQGGDISQTIILLPFKRQAKSNWSFLELLRSVFKTPLRHLIISRLSNKNIYVI